MAKIKQWENYFRGLDEKQLKKIRKSTEQLLDVPMVAEEYGWTGLGRIGTMAEFELKQRKRRKYIRYLYR